ncbi:MAG: hypothetical protein ACK58N_06550 [Synechocystis sp.]
MTNSTMENQTPVVFQENFNQFQPIDANQAWSLFFTAGKGDKKLGFNPESGRFFTFTLMAIVATGVVWSYFFSHQPIFPIQ